VTEGDPLRRARAAGQALRSLIEARNSADYESEDVTREEAVEALAQAERFVNAVAAWLGAAPSGPYKRRQWVPRAVLEEILGTPTDEGWLDDMRDALGDVPDDPWERG